MDVVTGAPGVPRFLTGPARIVWGWVTRRLLGKLYERSDRHYWQNRGFLRIWHPLTNEIQFSIKTITRYHPLRSMPKIALRRTDSATCESLTVLVEARAKVVYQEILEVQGVSEKPIIKALPSIPTEAVYTTEDGLYTPYQEIRVALLDESGGNGKTAILDGASRSFSPTYTADLNSKWKRRWGRLWNLDMIENGKLEIRNWMMDRCCASYFLRRVRRKSLSDHAIVCFGNFLMGNVAKNVGFWIAYWLRLADFDSQGNCRIGRKSRVQSETSE